MPFIASYPGKCGCGCEQQIFPGKMVGWSRGGYVIIDGHSNVGSSERADAAAVCEKCRAQKAANGTCMCDA